MLIMNEMYINLYHHANVRKYKCRAVYTSIHALIISAPRSTNEDRRDAGVQSCSLCSSADCRARFNAQCLRLANVPLMNTVAIRRNARG